MKRFSTAAAALALVVLSLFVGAGPASAGAHAHRVTHAHAVRVHHQHQAVTKPRPIPTGPCFDKPGHPCPPPCDFVQGCNDHPRSDGPHWCPINQSCWPPRPPQGCEWVRPCGVPGPTPGGIHHCAIGQPCPYPPQGCEWVRPCIRGPQG